MAVTHRRLGSHAALFSNICLGSTNVGGHIAEKERVRIVGRATLDRLDDIFPGPGGEAPMACAW